MNYVGTAKWQLFRHRVLVRYEVIGGTYHVLSEWVIFLRAGFAVRLTGMA